jgi:hypothetical protein
MAHCLAMQAYLSKGVLENVHVDFFHRQDSNVLLPVSQYECYCFSLAGIVSVYIPIPLYLGRFRRHI